MMSFSLHRRSLISTNFLTKKIFHCMNRSFNVLQLLNSYITFSCFAVFVSSCDTLSQDRFVTVGQVSQREYSYLKVLAGQRFVSTQMLLFSGCVTLGR